MGDMHDMLSEFSYVSMFTPLKKKLVFTSCLRLIFSNNLSSHS